jgi:hypothetical protein
MNCNIHPNMDAVGNCVSCGRGVCEECKVRINNLVHCRECVEAGRVKGAQAQPGPPPMYAAPPPFMPPPMRFIPRPRGPLKPNLFKIGGIGAFITGITMLIMGVSDIAWNYDNPIPGGFSSLFLIVIVYTIGLFVIAAGCAGIYWNYGSLSGMVGIVGILIMGPVTIMVVALMVPSFSNEDFSPSQVLVNSPLALFFAGNMTLIHLSVAYARHYIPIWHGSRKILAMARVTNIVGVVFFFSIVWIIFSIGVVGYFILGVALILFAIFFLTAPMPGDQEGRPQGAPS